MAWIESHQKLQSDAKLLDLIEYLKLDDKIGTNLAIGILHRFWWWCVDHAESGDLRPYNDNQLSRAVGWNGGAKEFVEAMAKAKFIEREPYFRVSNWWKFIGKYLQSKYKSSPERWKRVQAIYTEVLEDKL
ncbi:MAG: hypothetical protein Q8O19_00165, partial [Rectinemataceae bacterium]|nr:hypothetical protein [Rectinemataceae bacterium]